jgi:hypothetical protein
MGIFGPANILSVLFGASTTGSIYSFGYTLLVGVICNFVMGMTATRLMTKSLSAWSFARATWLYGIPKPKPPKKIEAETETETETESSDESDNETAGESL